MTMVEKLERLTRNAHKGKVCREAGITINALATYLKKPRPLRSSTIIGLAKALDVSPGWLIDDAKPWPPERVERLETAGAA